MKTRSFRFVAVAFSAAALSGCGVGALTPAHNAPSMHGSVAAGGVRPLLVDWGSNDRTLLDASRARGPLVVGYRDGTLEPLFSCHAHGRYKYTPERSAQVQDDIIETADELHVKMPAFGAKFQADLARAGKLHIRMKVVGMYSADKTTFDKADLDGDCTGATHVATYVTVGAFRLFTLSSAELHGDVAVPIGPDMDGKTGERQQSLNQAGDEENCQKASASDTQPPEGCSTSLQVVLAPLVSSDEPAAATEEHRSIVPLFVAGVGLVLGGASTAAWLVSDAHYRSLRDQCASDAGCSASAYDAKASSVKTWDKLSVGGWAVGGAMLLGGSVWYLSSGSNNGTERGVDVALDPTHGGVRMQGVF